jgi:hypothetical protein
MYNMLNRLGTGKCVKPPYLLRGEKIQIETPRLLETNQIVEMSH